MRGFQSDLGDLVRLSCWTLSVLDLALAPGGREAMDDLARLARPLLRAHGEDVGEDREACLFCRGTGAATAWRICQCPSGYAMLRKLQAKHRS